MEPATVKTGASDNKNGPCDNAFLGQKTVATTSIGEIVNKRRFEGRQKTMMRSMSFTDAMTLIYFSLIIGYLWSENTLLSVNTDERGENDGPDGGGPIR